MNKISKREFLCLSGLLSLLFPLWTHAANEGSNARRPNYPNTILALKKSFKAEMMAHKHYLGYVKKALEEEYPNIAYLFYAFSLSEKIHADNYKRIINELGGAVENISAAMDISDTRSNLKRAAEKELHKIKTFYPEALKILETESCEQAIVSCMYSLKSHRQHKEKVKEIKKYSGLFFGSVARRIEGVHFDFHICRICGSTIDKKPESPCEICNRSVGNYKKIHRPV